MKKLVLSLLFVVVCSSNISAMVPEKKESSWLKYTGYAIDLTTFAYAGARFFYEACIGYRSYQAVNSAQAPTLGTVSIPLLKEVSELMNLDHSTKIFMGLPNALGSPAAAGINMLYLTPDISLFAAEAQRFLLGHELSHIKHKDTRNRYIIAAIVPFVSFGLLKVYDIYSERLIEQLKSRTRNSKILTLLKGVGIINRIVATSPVTQYLLSLYITSKVSQYQELRADHESATILNAAKGGIELIKRFRSAEFNATRSQRNLIQYLESLPWHERCYVASTLLDPILGMPAHPQDEVRIAALEKLINK